MEQVCCAQHTGKAAGFHGSARLVNQPFPRGVVDLGFVSVRMLHIYCQSTNPKIMQRQTTGDSLQTEVVISRLNLEVLIMNYGDCWFHSRVNRELQACSGNLPSQLLLIILGLALPWDRLYWLPAVEVSQIFIIQFLCVIMVQ